MTTARLLEFFTRHPGLVLAFVLILGAIGWTFVQGRAQGVRRVGPGDVTRLINHEDALVLDVRTDAEFNQGHIVNALHVPQKYVADQLDKLDKHRGRPIVTVCRTGQESAKVGATLSKHGFEKVYSLGGGMLSWEGANLPVTRK